MPAVLSAEQPASPIEQCAGYDLARRFAPLPWPIVLVGPTGSGKTILAREIHRLSGRSGQFVKCALPAIPDSLRHSMLAGHVRGAFTGAREAHAGVIEQARGGTLLLDEIDLATPEQQQLLLGPLEDGCVTRLGDCRPRPVDTRFVMATNADLGTLRERGQFRDDLFWRLGLLKIALPRLTERRREIVPLAEMLLRQSLDEVRKAWRAEFSEGAAACLERHNWPGNIRELRGVCQWIVSALDTDRPVELEDLPAYLAGDAPGPGRSARRAGDPAIRAALERHHGNVSEAARELKIGRTMVYRRLGAECSLIRRSFHV